MTIDQFEQFRPLLFSIAYRMLGTVSEAEDMVQEAWLRVQGALAETVEKPKQYLTTIVTHLCLNQLSAARTQREQYLGTWLPEPINTDEHPELLDPAHVALAHESIALAFLVLLEKLSPLERAAFLLHEVFGYKHQEVGIILSKSEAACRQLFRRAQQHLRTNRPRFEATPTQHEHLLHSFIKAVELGEIDAFLQLLAEDVALVPDGGGERGAAIHIVQGRDAVAAFALGTYRRSPAGVRYAMLRLNGQPAIVAYTAEGRPYYALFLYGVGEQVSLIHLVAGRKLKALAQMK